MTPPALVLLGLAALVITGTVIALAGRWQPDGLPAAPPDTELPRGRFDVVLRGYRMDQVDAELDRLRGLLAGQPASELPDGGGDPTVET